MANEAQTKIEQTIELGVIGEDKQFVLEEDYNPTAIPALNKPIKLRVSVEEFNKFTFKAFTKANSKRAKPIGLHYKDSTIQTLKFLKLELADRVSILDALSHEENKDVKSYLSNKPNAHMVTAISVVFDEATMTSLLEADAVFLEENVAKNYMIKVYRNNLLALSIKFNNGVVFAYQTSNFCWQEDTKRQLHIVDIVESNDKCPKKTYRSAQRAKKKINYYKF